MSGSTGRLAPSTAYGTCTAVYCHSNGGANGAAVVYNTVTWGGAALNCGSCHANMATTAAANGGHYKHASAANVGGPAFDCSVCHSGYTTTSTNGSTHANKFVELITAVTGYSKASPMAASGTWGTCSTSQCHGQALGLTWNNGSIWQTGGDHCTTCHSSTTGVTVGTPFYSTSFPSKQTLNTNAKVGAHTLHMTSTNVTSAAFSCSECHGAVTMTGPTHMNGATTFTWGALASANGASPSFSGGVCSNVYCHGAKMPRTDASGTHRAPTWNVPFMTGTIADCAACHGLPPTGHPTFTITSFSDIASTCKNCHTNINPLGTSYATMFLNKAEHINGVLETPLNGPCNSCHGYPPTRKSFTGGTGNWVNAKIENYTGGGGVHTVAGHVNPNAVIADEFSRCTPCHRQADHNMSLAIQPSNVKVNIDQRARFSEDRVAKYKSNGLDGAAHVSGTCSNVACHFQKTPKW